MLRSSLPIGTFFGVEVRVHLSFPLLLVLALSLSAYFTQGLGRGFALWLALCFAVLVREAARAIAAAYAGLHLRAIYLLPVGGVMAFSSSDGASLHATGSGRRNTRWVTLSGPIANFATGLFILAFSLSIAPQASLLAQPWISLGHILRSMLWTQILLGGISLLPASAMPTRQLLRTAPQNAGKSAASRKPMLSFGTGMAIAMILAGVLIPYLYWLVALGVFLLLYLQVTKTQTKAGADADTILVREVMLTEYTLLSSSETLRDALDRTIHSLHDIFPVVRGERLVGSITRQTIAERLLSGGDSYLQGAMTRKVPLAAPDEKLVDVLRRVSLQGTGEFIPVIEDDRMIGILSHQSLGRAVQQVKLLRPAPSQQSY
ncbi:CBS domain-containing protein [Granulicella sp. 5B5]|uniref:CBS domain-containing protein n=1 Tax=Granulicella sp. 5B5 TaxID=1617967 RepID=UPI0015F65D5E|nr:CBS domain-containing protein [Granulicella sp. 5B5]